MPSNRNVYVFGPVFIFIMTLLLLPACSSTTFGASPAGFNVKGFGAVGDGKTDDTDAIQRAILAASNAGQPLFIRQNRPRNETEKRSRKKKILVRPEIVFPVGTYRISRPIVLINYAHIRGIGKSVIRQSDPKQDTFYLTAQSDDYGMQSVHFVVKGLRFEGGKTQLHIWPRNVNATLVSIERCEFINSTDYAIVCRMYAQPGYGGKRVIVAVRKKRNREGKPQLAPKKLYWPPYLIEWRNHLPYLKPNPAPRDTDTYNSTLLRIANCKFDNCMGVADVSSDITFLRDCEINVSPEMDGAIFNLPVGSPHLYRLHCVATPTAGKHPYWIRGDSRMSVRQCSFDTTTKNGIDFIRDWDENPAGEKYVTRKCTIVEQTRVKVAGGPSNALLWLGKRYQPNIISLIDVTETSGKPVKAIAWESPRSLLHLKEFRSALNNVDPLQLHKILLAGNSPNISEKLPLPAEALRETPASAEQIQEVTVPPLAWKSDDLWREVQVTLNAADFGLDGDPETDDTAVLQKLFDTAAKKGVCEIVFPAGVYRVSQPICLPPKVFLRGAGLAVFLQTSLDKDIFHAQDARLLGFENVLLKDGRYGIDITPATGAKTRFAFTNCWFTDQAVAVRCLPAEKDPTAEILIDGGYIDAQQAVVSNVKTQIEAVWVFNGRTLENQGFFENHGTMRLQAVLGVPSRYPKNQMLPNPRWVDNFGKFQSLDTRYGGEGGGFCNIYNRSAAGTVYVNGYDSRSGNPAGRKCLLYLEKTPRAAVLQSISTAPWFIGRYKGCSTILDPQGRTRNDNVHISGLTSPDTLQK